MRTEIDSQRCRGSQGEAEVCLSCRKTLSVPQGGGNEAFLSPGLCFKSGASLNILFGWCSVWVARRETSAWSTVLKRFSFSGTEECDHA